MRMQVVGRLGSYISRGVSTVSGSVRPLGGAVDIVIVEQPDGSFKSSPWYVRFGRSRGVLRTEDRLISISVNGEEANFHMFMDYKGRAFFLREAEGEEGESVLYPLSSGEESDTTLDERHLKTRSICFESVKSNGMDQGDMNTGMMLARNSSTGSIGDHKLQSDIIAARSMESATIAANLLELKWSTNLASRRPPRKGRGQFQKRKSQLYNMDKSSNQRSLDGEACSLDAQEGPCSKPDPEVQRGLNEDDGISSSCSGTTVEVIYSKGKTEVTTEQPISGDVREDTPHDRKMKEDVTDITANGLKASCLQLDNGIENKLLSGEDVSGVPGYRISEKEFPPNGDLPLVYSRMSKSSTGSMHCTTDKTFEEFYPDDKKSEAIVLPEVTKNEEVSENADVMMPVLTVSQTSQQSNCTHHGISKSLVADIKDQTTLRDNQTVILDIGHCSFEKVGVSSSNSSLGDQALEEEAVNVEEVSSTLTSHKSTCDCVCGKTSRQPSPNHEEKDFVSSDIGAGGQTADPDKLRVTSNPTVVLNNDDGDEDKKQTKSLSDSLHSHTSALDQHDLCHPSIHSQESACNILNQSSFGKDDVKSPQPDGELLHEESGSKDSDDVKSTNTNPPLDVSTAHKPPPGGNWRLWSFMRRSNSEVVTVPGVDEKDNNSSESSINKDAEKNELKPKLLKKYVRAKTPTAEQLASLNLKEGKNTITFTFSVDMLENELVEARIYLWKWNSRIVISDVDGTITKSDVLGQVMPLVGVDWSQTGVTHLFSAIEENGYKLLFLSARSISQAYQTRQFLVNLKQDGKVLPDGPIVISPDGIFPSLYREVIRRAPHEFKISCLEDIKALFPHECSPFYAGFGNRDTDEISYLKVGIPRGKIFIINPKGEIVVNQRHDTKTYTSLHAMVHGMFPPTNTSEQEDFNSWNYWKVPHPDLKD